MSTPQDQTRYKLVFTVPHSALEQCKTAIFAKGIGLLHNYVPPANWYHEPDAGCYPNGNYTNVCFETPGEGQFLPGTNAHPNIGEPGKLERVKEMRVETLCVGGEVMREAVKALVE